LYTAKKWLPSPGLAPLLAAMGIYNVLSYTVQRRVREIGIRMALGASQSDILCLVVGDGMKPILTGVAIGLTAALALSRLVASLGCSGYRLGTR
jgi:ABC-type antimicrobial peptide transport system permease subunit